MHNVHNIASKLQHACVEYMGGTHFKVKLCLSYISDIYDCYDITCQNNGTCIDEVNGYRCECQSDFSGPQCQYDGRMHSLPTLCTVVTTHRQQTVKIITN